MTEVAALLRGPAARKLSIDGPLPWGATTRYALRELVPDPGSGEGRKEREGEGGRERGKGKEGEGGRGRKEGEGGRGIQGEKGREGEGRTDGSARPRCGRSHGVTTLPSQL